MTYIYSLEYPENNVRYIGKTLHPKKRLSEHINKAIKRNDLTYKVAWIRSLLKQNIKPIMKIIDIVPDNEASFWEKHYISLFKSFAFKLTNGTRGGDGVTLPSDTVKKKISDSLKKYYESHIVWNKGRKSTQDERLRMLGVVRKKVFQYTLDGCFVREWPNVKEISRVLNLSYHPLTRKCKCGSVYGGYLWSYEKH